MISHRVNESNILLTCFGDKLPIRWLRDMNKNKHEIRFE